MSDMGGDWNVVPSRKKQGKAPAAPEQTKFRHDWFKGWEFNASKDSDGAVYKPKKNAPNKPYYRMTDRDSKLWTGRSRST